MKKNILFALLLVSSAGFAQNFDFGIKAGTNISNFTGGNIDNVKSSALVGFHAGAFVSLYLGHNFAIVPEVQYGTQGAKLDNNTTKADYKFEYITIPVLVKYRFNGGFYVEAGPQIAFNVHSTVAGTSGDFAKSTDLGVGGGIGYHSSIGLGIGARYMAGLNKVGNFDISNVQPDYRNSLFQISIFYTFFNRTKK